MFDSDKRYITKGIQSKLPTMFIVLIFGLIDDMVKKRNDVDYFQVFRISETEDGYKVIHSQESPEYCEVINVISGEEKGDYLDKTIYFIDDGDHSTLLFADEY